MTLILTRPLAFHARREVSPLCSPIKVIFVANTRPKIVRFDPLSLPYLAAAAEETAHSVVALWERIKALQAELEVAAEWREGALWWCDRELEPCLHLMTLARILPGRPALPGNVISG